MRMFKRLATVVGALSLVFDMLESLLNQ